MNSFSILKKFMVAMLLVVFTTGAAFANTYTATASGNFSSSSTWSGGNVPGTNITGADAIIVNAGVNLTLDHSVTINNAAATFTVLSAASVTGTGTGISVISGSLTGAGDVILDSLTVGSTATLTVTGSLYVGTLINNQLSLSLTDNVQVNNTLVLNSGSLQIGTGGLITVANNATINFAGGSYSPLGGGSLNLVGSVNLIYSGTASSMTPILNLSGINNVTVNLASSSGQLNMGSNLNIAGSLTVQSGQLNTTGNNITVAGTITTSANGSINSTPGTNITVGSGNSTLSFTTGGTIVNNLTVGAGASGSVSLNSDLDVTGALALNSGSVNIGSSTLTLGGAVTGSGTLTGSSSSGLVLNGSASGGQGTLTFTSGGGVLGNLTVNNTGTNGSVSLGSNLTVSGALSLTGGTLNLNGNTVTLGGTISASGNGALGGSLSSGLVITGTGNIGVLVFSSDSTINNLTINASGSGSYINLGSNVNVSGTLTLTNGNIQTGNFNLSLTGTGSVSGGSATSFVATTGSGSLIANVGTTVNTMFQVGDSANYAPVSVTNNSSTAGNFTVNAHAGVYANGTSGNDLSTTQNSVNTSWNVESDITTGANVSLTAYWSAAMDASGFNNTTAYLSHYTGGAWDESTSSSVTAGGNGMFSVSRGGITSFSPFAVFGTNATGIATVAPATVISLYPNPAKNNITLALPTLDKDQQARIFDAIGNDVIDYPVNTLVSSIDISHLPAGVYFLSLNNKYTSRFIKQ